MKRFLVILSLTVIAFISRPPMVVFAYTSVPTPTTVNARILPTVWYSSLSVNDGDTIKIFAGIQNNSGFNFTGLATFYVDNNIVTTIPYSSLNDSLINISASWVANPGDHNVQVSVTASLPTDKVLVSTATDKSSISIIRNITPAIVQNAVINTANNVVTQVDTAANALADKVQSMKVSTSSASSGGNNSLPTKKSGSVLGASTGPGTSSSKTTASGFFAGDNMSPLTFLYNAILDFLAFLLRNWKWTLGAIFILLIFTKIYRKFSKE